MTETPTNQNPEDNFDQRALAASRDVIGDSEERRRKRRDTALLAGTLILATPVGIAAGNAGAEALHASEEARNQAHQETLDQSRQAFEEGLDNGKIQLTPETPTYDEFLQANDVHAYEPTAEERAAFDASQVATVESLPTPQQGNPNPAPDPTLPTPKTH